MTSSPSGGACSSTCSADLRERRLSLDAHRHVARDAGALLVGCRFALPGAESGRDAQRRAIGMLDLLRSRHPDGGRLVLGSHGNLISLILQALEPGIGYDFHMAMPMPALYRLTHDGLRWRIMGGHGFAPVEWKLRRRAPRGPRASRVGG